MCDDKREGLSQLEKLAQALNERRARYLNMANCTPGNDLARQQKHEAIGYLRALDDIAADMGLKTEVRYTT